ncbi:MAG TPA: AraC family transcriptional regulator ligand-binding domain-containing protein [Polyangiales bacterium]|nr:AraC family transcriptional regulator ligand-binding domain-containing protein [Polyangiales bacterium]
MCWLLLGYLRRQRVDVGALLTRNGFSLDTLMTPDTRIRLHELHRLWRLAQHAVGDDESLGVKVASMVDPLATRSWLMPFSLLESISRSSATLRDGAERQRPYLRLMRDGFMINVDEWQAGRCLVRWEYANLEEEPRALVEFQLSLAVLLTRRTLTNKQVTPLEVWFAHPAPRDISAYTALYGRAPRFSAECNALVVNGAGLHAPLATHEPEVLKVLEHQARSLLQQLPSLEDFVACVRQHIQSELPHGNTTASAVADKLGISGRTLHRRLRSHGTTYQEQLDQVRYRLAASYLASRRYPLGEVASLVGFAQQSAFQRAFKTWAGQTPAEYQQSGMPAVTALRPRDQRTAS